MCDLYSWYLFFLTQSSTDQVPEKNEKLWAAKSEWNYPNQMSSRDFWLVPNATQSPGPWNRLPHHRQPPGKNKNLDHGQGQPDLHELKESQSLPLLLRVLDDDHVACRTKDREVAGNRAAGRKGHQLGRAAACPHHERLEERNEWHIGDELADDHARAKEQRDGREHRAADERLEVTGLPDACHQDKHRGKKDERAPVYGPEDPDAFLREEKDGESGTDRDQRQGHEHGPGDERCNDIGGREQQDDRKGDLYKTCEPFVTGDCGHARVLL